MNKGFLLTPLPGYHNRAGLHQFAADKLMRQLGAGTLPPHLASLLTKFGAAYNALQNLSTATGEKVDALLCCPEWQDLLEAADFADESEGLAPIALADATLRQGPWDTIETLRILERAADVVVIHASLASKSGGIA